MDLSMIISMIYYVYVMFLLFCILLFLLDSVLMRLWLDGLFPVDVPEVVPNMSLEQGHVWDVWPEFAHTGSIHFSFQSILGHWINLHWNMIHACCCCFGYRKATERQWTEESWAIVGVLYPDTKPILETSSQTMNNIARQRPSPPCNFQSFQGDLRKENIQFCSAFYAAFHLTFCPISMESSPSARSVERGYPVVSVSRSISRIEHITSWTGLCGARHRQWQRWEMFATSTHM